MITAKHTTWRGRCKLHSKSGRKKPFCHVRDGALYMSDKAGMQKHMRMDLR